MYKKKLRHYGKVWKVVKMLKAKWNLKSKNCKWNKRKRKRQMIFLWTSWIQLEFEDVKVSSNFIYYSFDYLLIIQNNLVILNKLKLYIPYLRKSNAHPDFEDVNKEKKSSLTNVMRVPGMVNLNFILFYTTMDLYKYRQSRGSFLSDTVIT